MRLPTRPCPSCPYRRDVPSGLWHASEYEKLPPYDQPTGEQPTGVFMCHMQDGRVCAGWVGCHDMQEMLALRLAVIAGRFAPDDMDALIDYVSPVPLFATGAVSSAVRRRLIAAPGPAARRKIDRLRAQRERRRR